MQLDEIDEALVQEILLASERRRHQMLSEATKRGLAEAKKRGRKLGGSKEKVDLYAVTVILSMVKDGYSFSRIARSLDAREIDRPRSSGPWDASNVARIYRKYTPFEERPAHLRTFGGRIIR